MTTIKIILYLPLFAALSFCGQQTAKITDKKFVDGKQVPVLDSSETDVHVLAPDTVFGDDEYYAKISIDSKDEKLLDVYASCDFSSSLVDTVTQQLDNCKISLEVKADTAQFHIWPADSNYSFLMPVAFLTVGKDNQFRLRTLKLKINSKKKTNH